MTRLIFVLVTALMSANQACAAGPDAGQWHDRTRSGYGLDINRAGGALFGALYLYDSAGQPEWLYLQVTDRDSPAGDLTRFRKIGTQPPVPSIAGQFSLAAVNACADGAPRPGAAQLMELAFTLASGPQRWCIEPLLPLAAAPESALDGHWYVPGTPSTPDSGWGLITHYYPGTTASGQAQTQTFQTFYFYDDAGNPRWSVANTGVSGFRQSLDFYALSASCFNCPASFSSSPIGRAEHTLRSSNFGASNPLAVNMRLGGSNFTRSGNLQLLSTPRAQPAVRSVQQGLVQGRLTADGVTRFSNIPYVAPPLGALRLRAPQPAPLRDAVLAATEIGPGCLQPDNQALFNALPARQSEDCLQLNVWQPLAASPTNLAPVLVWIHGGGLTIGSAVEQVGSRLVYDGSAFARKGVVLVSINYRLGVFGFGGFRAMQGEAPDQPSAGNYGLLDQIAALKWVRENIVQFGGDANNITIFGESAGGVSTCALMAAPAARGLFARAISQSGNCLRAPQTLEAALATGDRVLANALCANLSTAANTRGCLRSLSSAALLTASRAAINLGISASSSESYSLNVDGFVLSESPASAIASGRAAPVPFLLGVNDDESTSTTPAASLPSTAEAYAAAIRAQFVTIADLVLARYPAAGYATPQKAYQDLLDDVRFTCANRRAASDHAARGNVVYHFALTDVLPDAALAPLESFHGIDISFLFGRPTALAAEQNLSEKMQNAWVNFAHSGDPGGALGYVWPRYTEAAKQSAELNRAALAPVADYRGVYCEFWARYVQL